jgi:hypothetical protein
MIFTLIFALSEYGALASQAFDAPTLLGVNVPFVGCIPKDT